MIMKHTDSKIRLHLKRIVLIFAVLCFGFVPEAKASSSRVFVDNYYLLFDAEDLLWFADQVNAGNDTICGRLYNDIYLSSLEQEYWNPIGRSDSKPFRGKFDGRNKTIYGLTISADNHSGLFGCVANATVENVNIDGTAVQLISLPSIYGYIGALCGEAQGSVIRNCHVKNINLDFTGNISNLNPVYVGGVCGSLKDESRIVNCSMTGIIRTLKEYAGGIAGDVSLSEIDSCSVSVGDSITLINAESYAGGIAGATFYRTAEASIKNCTVGNDVEVSSDKVGKSATVCAYENLINEINVYKGAYEICNAAQLAIFRDKVNGGDIKINGRLMNDINMSSAGAFTPIGKQSNGGYQGVFDGQDFTIDSLTIADQEYAGLFSYISKEGTAVKNIMLNSPSLSTTSNNFLGFVVGMATQKASVDNCRVTGGSLVRVAKGEPSCVGGIAGKADVGATVTHCSFQGTIHAMEKKVGGIVGELNSGAVISSCYVIGPAEIWGDDYVGGIVGEIIDDATTAVDCYANQANGQVTVHVTDGSSNSGLIWGKNGSKNAGTFTRYTEGGLVYEKTGHISNDVESVIVTGVADKSKSLHHVVYDIGTKYDYATDSIQNLQGAKSIDFIDCISNIAGTEACRWINIGISDGAFDSSFEAIYMRYTVYAGDDHVMMLRPCDVYPLGDAMFLNCPNAKVYIDTDLYADFCADPVWGKYKDHFVSTTSMRKDVDFTEDGVKYAYDRNHDATGSVVKKKATLHNSSSNVTMVHVVGCDDSKIADNSGTLKVYQDIGETYNYNTTRILGGSFKDNGNIKRVMFEEIMSNASDSYYDFTIQIGDSAFKNCKNLEYFDIVISSSKNKKHYTSIHAKEMPIGNGVFDGCPNVKIRIPGPMMDEFRTDSLWSQYKDLFVQADFSVTAFTESGVNYAYYISSDGKTYYTNKNADEMRSVLTPYVGQIRNFKADDVLDADNSNTIYYVYANGVDNDAINKKGGELRLFNDIGSYYNYKTIAVSSSGFRDNESIKKIVFEDCASNVSNANTMISLFIPDGAFQGCKNLKELNLYYLQTDDDNRYYALKPNEVFIGENVFDGVSQDFHIVVSPDYYNDFLTDANWSQYSKYIVASEYLPTVKSAKTVEGLTYDYAANSLNTIPTSTISDLQMSYVYTGLHIAYVIATSITTLGVSVIDKTAVAAWQIASNLSYAFNLLKIGSLQYQSATQADAEGMSPTDMRAFAEGMVGSFAYYYALYYTIPDLFLGVLAGTVWEATSYQAYYDIENWVRESMEGKLDYLSHRIERMCKRATVSRSNGLGVYYTQQRNNIPKMYISHVNDDLETARIYNDVGTGSDDYHTVAVGREAFHNKTKLKKVEFYDRPDTYQSLSSMQLVLPDSCFAGCTNLQTIDLVLSSKRSGGRVALTPDNFILSGRNLFAGCDTTKLQILVGRDVLDEYLEDPFWAYYSSRFVAVDVPANPVKYTEGNVNYGYAYFNNTTPLQSEINDHSMQHLNVVSGNNEKLKSNSGQATLVNDIGTVTSYKVDNIEKCAFKGNDNLKSFHFMDTNSNISQAYADLSVDICDSAFANCKNFTDLYLVYWKTSGANKSVSISPDSLRLGKGVFDGCDNLRIKMDISQEAAFRADTCWNKYADKFQACLFAPKDDRIYELLKKYAYVSPLPDQTTDHIDLSGVKPWDVFGTFRFDRYIKSFDEFSAFAACGMDSIYNRMFELCSKLQSITLPSTIKKIGDYVFHDCDNLSMVTIPKSVYYMGDYVFKDSGVKEIIFESDTPPNLKQHDGYTFSTIIDKAGAMVYVPDSAVEKYKEYWTRLARAGKIKGISQRRTLKEVHLTEPGTLADSLGLKYNYVTGTSEDITLDGGYAQYDSLRISGPLDGRDIGVLRFLGGRDVEDCDVTPGRLKYLDLCDAQIKAGSYEYNRHYALEQFSISNLFQKNNYIKEDNCISTSMFFQLDALETLILPRSATKIETYSISHCANLKTLVVGDSVKQIDGSVVYNDLSLDYLVMTSRSVPTTETTAWSKHGLPLKAVIVPETSRWDYMSRYAYYNTADTITHLFANEALAEVMTRHHIHTPQDVIAISDIKGWVNGNNDINTFDELYSTKILALRDSSLVDMSELEQITLPAYLFAISSGAIKNCPSLRTIWAMGDFVPAIGKDAFETINKDFVVYVPESKLEYYRTSWAQYADHIRVAGASDPTDNLIEVTLTKPNTLAEALGLKVLTEYGYLRHYGEEGDPDREVLRIVKGISGDYHNIKALKVNGPICGEDIAVLRLLGGRDANDNARVYLSNMSYLDLYDANIVTSDMKIVFAYNPKVYGIDLEDDVERYVEADNKIPRMMFRTLDNINTLILPRSATELGYEACYDMYSLKKLVVGEDMTYIDNDALGECNNLKTIVMLCKSKPKLHDDAFTDPTFEGDVLKVDRFYVPKDQIADYTSDTEYTTHTSAISVAFDGDKTFRALGRNAIATNDDLAQVTSYKRLFRKHCEDVTDLSVLSGTAADSVHAADFSNMPSLQRLSLPATVKTIEPDAFAGNGNLHWLDISRCDSLGGYNGDLGVNDNAVVYVPASFGESDKDNVVYGSGNALECAKYNLTDTHEYDVPKAFTARSVTFNRTFDADSVATLTLPFTCRVPEGMRAYQFEDGHYNEIHFGQVDTIRTNQPYAVKVDEEFSGFNVDSETAIETTPVRMPQVNGAGYTSFGTLSAISAADADGQNLLTMNGEALWNVLSAKDSIGILPFTSYLQTKNDDAPTKDVITYFDDLLVPNIDLYESQDNTDTIDFYNMKRANVRLTRTLVAGAWNTFCVPFDVTVSRSPLKGASVLGVKEIKDNCISYKQVTSLQAGKAYLVKPAANIVNPTFDYVRVKAVYPEYAGGYDYIGIYSPMTIDNSKTVYFLGGDGYLKLAKAGSVMKGFRAYYKVAPASEAKLVLEFDDGIVDTIGTVDDDRTGVVPTAIYSVDGVYMGDDLDSLPGGVYIMNGKKVVK